MMQIPICDPTDIKIYILSLLTEVSYPLDYSSIHDLVCDGGYVRPLDFAECFADLCERSHIFSEELDGVVYYSVSQVGKSVARELESSIPDEIHCHSVAKASALLSLRKRGAEAECTVTPDGEGNYSVMCRIFGYEGELMNCKVIVHSDAMAQSIRAHFTQKPEQVMRALMTALAGDLDFLFS